MQNYYNVLKKTSLFKNVEITEYESVLSCLSAKKETYNKNDFVLSAGQTEFKIGILLSGELSIIKEDYYGNKTILSSLNPSDLFAESYVCAGVKELPVSVVAKSGAEILFIDFKQLITKTNKCLSCSFREKLIENMLFVLASKNVALNLKLEHVSKRSIREKMLSYLNETARIKRSTSFVIPFNREELAAYLSVDRSALSKELSKMQQEGIISYRKNSFKLNV